MSPRPVHRIVAAACVGLLAFPLAGCQGAASDPDVVKIGWMGPLTGTVKVVGEEMRAAAELYLDVHDGQLGGRKVELEVMDEGETPEDAMPNAQRLVKEEEVVAMAGILYSPTFLGVAQLAQENGIPLLGSGGRPSMDREEMNDFEGLWHTSWVNEQTGQALAPYVHEELDGGPVYAIGPDDAGGHANVGGFVKGYLDEGGELANEGGKEPTWTPFPDTADWTPWLNEIAASDAEAIFSFYGGSSAVDFVTQYAQSDAADLPLYTNFITEGAVLKGQGEAALGVQSSVPYSADLDNAANREFVSEWTTTREDLPSTMAVSAWDSMLVLDMAISKIPDGEEVTSEKITEEIGKIGEINSPRGSWRFGEETHAPIQRYYLREVRQDGEKIANVVLETLDTLGE